MSIYQEIVARGIKHANHYSDLYIPVTMETKELVRQYKGAKPQTFVNQVEGGLWYDVAFAYEPYWQEKQTKAA